MTSHARSALWTLPYFLFDIIWKSNGQRWQYINVRNYMRKYVFLKKIAFEFKTSTQNLLFWQSRVSWRSDKDAFIKMWKTIKWFWFIVTFMCQGAELTWFSTWGWPSPFFNLQIRLFCFIEIKWEHFPKVAASFFQDSGPPIKRAWLLNFFPIILSIFHVTNE